MKIEQKQKKEFIPVTITIETEEELCDLWHRYNLSPTGIDNSSCFDDCLKHTSCVTGAWKSIDNLAKQNNLYK